MREATVAPHQPPDEFFTLHRADARRLSLLLSRYSSPSRPLLTTTITSPPYFDLKDYGHADQVGYGQREDEYLVDIRRVFGSIFEHTRPEGSLWVIADTLRPMVSEKDVRRMQLLPFQLANEAETAGWFLRDVIVWLKDKTLPWSSRGRTRNEFEYILFFVKSPKFKYHIDRLREPTDLAQWWVRYPERYNPKGKAPGNVWAVPIPVQGSWANTAIQHACPLPADLVERMLLLSTDEGDVVLDPFAGSGVVVAEAERLARRGFGVELVDRYVDAFISTVRPEILERRGADVLQQLQNRGEELRRTILDLRAVKYAKVVMLRSRDTDPTLPRPFAVYALRRPSTDTELEVVLVLHDEDRGRSDDYLTALNRAVKRKPASKFGLTPSMRVVGMADIPSLHRGRRLWAYVGGQTHRAEGLCRSNNVRAWAARPTRHQVPLVVSNVYVNESPRRLRLAENGVA